MLEFAGPLVSKRGFDPQYASVFDRYAASTRSLLDMFRFSFDTKFGKDKKPIKILTRDAEYAAGRNFDKQRNAKETQRVRATKHPGALPPMLRQKDDGRSKPGTVTWSYNPLIPPSSRMRKIMKWSTL